MTNQQLTYKIAKLTDLCKELTEDLEEAKVMLQELVEQRAQVDTGVNK